MGSGWGLLQMRDGLMKGVAREAVRHAPFLCVVLIDEGSTERTSQGCTANCSNRWAGCDPASGSNRKDGDEAGRLDARQRGDRSKVLENPTIDEEWIAAGMETERSGELAQVGWLYTGNTWSGTYRNNDFNRTIFEPRSRSISPMSRLGARPDELPRPKTNRRQT